MNKKILIIFILGILLLGSVDAANWDNKLTYSNNDLKVEFRNSILGVIPTTYLGTIELKSHNSINEIRKLGEGSNQPVIFYDFKDWDLYEGGLGEATFTDMRTGEEIERDYYLAERVFEQKPKYKTKCIDKQNANGTYSEECSQVENGFKQVEVWKKLDLNDIPNRNTRIGLITDVKNGDYIDVVIEVAGKKVSKHATWTASLNVGLVVHYDFEDNTTLIDSINNQNGTIVGADGIETGIPGIIGFGWRGNGIDDDGRGYVNITGFTDSSGTYSYSMWMSPHTNATNNDMVFFDTQVGRKLIWFPSDNSGGNIGFFDGTARDTGVLPEADVMHHYVITDNDTGYFVYVDSVLTGSNTSRTEVNLGGLINIGAATVTIGTARYIGDMDEFGIWNRSLSQAEITQLYNGGSGITFVGIFPPSVTLNSPIDNFNTTNPTITFNGTISVAVPLNVSLIINDVYNETNSTGILGDYIFTKNFVDGTYTWNIEACNSDGCTNGTARTFTVDTNPPTIIIEAPTGTLNLLKQDQNITLNFTATDNLLDTCLWEYNNTNTTISCNNGTKTNTGFNYQIDFNNGTIYANDSLNNIGSEFTSWEFKITELNQTFNNQTTEGVLEEFEAEIMLGSGFSITGASLVYNGTSNVGTSSTSGDITTLNILDVLIPTVSADVNLSFFWAIVLSDSSIINLSTQNQTVFNLDLDDCSVFTNRIFNFTSRDEEMQTHLSNTTKEIAINVYPSDRGNVVFNLSDQYETNPTTICLNVNLTEGATYSLDTVVKYEAVGYAIEYYNIVDLELTNETEEQKIFLFNLNQTDSTEFQLTFTGEDFLPVEDALVFVERQYIAENTFKTVELPKTDSNGQAILHLVRNDIVYNIIIMKDKVVLGEFTNLIAFCDDFSIGDCKINLNAISGATGVFNYDEGIGILYDSPPVYNETTKVVSFDFTSTDGTSRTVLMEVERRDVFGNTSVCSNTLVSTSGTLSCNVGNVTETSLVTVISIGGEKWLSSQVQVDSEAYGSMGYVALFILTLTLIIIFGDSKNGVIISTIISYMAAIAMGWLIGGIIGLGTSGVWIIVSTIVAIWQVNKNRST